MDSSNAEKAWEDWFETSTDHEPCYAAFMGAWRARDAEVAELTRLLAESRARFGDSEARRAELEAAIQAVRDLADKAERGALRWADPLPVPEWVPRVRVVLSEPSVVLEDRDREVAARAVESARDKIMPPYNWTLNPVTGAEDPRLADADQVYCEVHGELSEIAAAIRKGDTNA